jgi:hypothetical protein
MILLICTLITFFISVFIGWTTTYAMTTIRFGVFLKMFGILLTQNLVVIQTQDGQLRMVDSGQQGLVMDYHQYKPMM